MKHDLLARIKGIGRQPVYAQRETPRYAKLSAQIRELTLEYAELLDAKRGIAKPDDIRFAIAADSNVLITGADCAARFAIARLICEAQWLTRRI